MRSTKMVRMLALAALAVAAFTEAPAEHFSEHDDGVASVAGGATLDNFLDDPESVNRSHRRLKSASGFTPSFKRTR